MTTKRKDIVGLESLRNFEKTMGTEFVPEVFKVNIEQGQFYAGYKNVKQFFDLYAAKPLFIFVYNAKDCTYELTETKVVFFFRDRLLVIEPSDTTRHELSLYSDGEQNDLVATDRHNRPAAIGVASDKRIAEWYDYLVQCEREKYEYLCAVGQERKELLQTAIRKYGSAAQLMQSVEELAELITAINHYIRQRPDAENDLISEVADVRIMCDQLALLVGEDKVRAAERYKLNRLQIRLNKA